MSRLILTRGTTNNVIGGNFEVFGTTSSETLRVLDGSTLTFRTGFNAGGDTIRLDGPAANFTVSIVGSNVTLRSVADNITIVLPIGTVANTIAFEGGDNRSLSLINGVATLGNQAISQDPLNPTIVTAGGGGAGAGQTFTLTSGADTVGGTTGTDTINGRISEFSSFDTIQGGTGIDTLVLTGTLPQDFQNQPSLVDGAFANTRGVERLIIVGSTSNANNADDATLGTLARQAGLQEVVAGGTGNQSQNFNILGFDGALTVTGSANAENVQVNAATPGLKTLNLGDGADTVDVTAAGALAGSIQVNFTSASVGNGSNENVTVGTFATVNDEGTTIRTAVGGANMFRVVGLENGVVDPTQDRGTFSQIELGTSGGDTATTLNGTGNQYFNLGAGNDTITANAEAGERHFVVGGAGQDSLTAETQVGGARVVAIMGTENDTVTVNTNNGAVDVNLGDGDDLITFNNLFFANAVPPAANVDTVAGGAGRDTLAANSGQLTTINNTVAGAVQTVSGFEALTVLNGLAGDLTTSRIQAGIDTVTLNAGFGGANTVTFDSGLASTLNLAASAGGSGIRVASAGTGTADQVTIRNTAPAQGSGAALNAFNGQAITTTGVETLVINTSATGTATTQTIGGISGTPAGRVNFVGGNSVNAGTVEARNVDASGLTGTAGITASTVTTVSATVVNTFTGSGANDTVTLGAGRQNLNLGAGNDTVTITTLNDLQNGTSTLAGGDGTDTIRTTVELASTLSVANPFNANTSGFETLAFSAAQVNTRTDVIRVDNLNVNRVVSLGTAPTGPGAVIAQPVIVDGIAPVAGQQEQVTVSAINGLASGESLTFTAGGATRTITAGPATAGTASVQRFNVDDIDDTVPGAETMSFTIAGRTITITAEDTGFPTFIQAGLTAAEVAAAFASGVNGSADLGTVTWTITGTLDPAFTVAASGGQLVFTAASPGVQPALTVTTFATNDGPNNTAPAFVPVGAGAGDSNLGTNPTTGSVSAAQVASMLATGVAVGGATVANAGAFPFGPGTVTGNSVAFSTPGNTPVAPNAAATVSGGVAPTVTTTQEGIATVVGQAETATFTFVPLLAGQSIIFAGRTVTATADVTADAVAEAFVTAPAATNLAINGLDVVGAITAGYAPTRAGPVVTLTGPQSNETNLTATAPTREGTIVLQNMTSGDTLEIAAASTGTHEVRIIDAGLNTNDVLNVVLTNAGATGRNYGTVTTLNTERVNVNLNDTGTAASTNDAATIETLNLSIAQTRELVVTGSNGLTITQNAAGLTLFDASGIVANSANDSANNLGVFFTSANNTAGAAVTIRGGAGNDDLIGAGANDTFELGTGGSDLVQFRTTRGANGQDVVNGFTGGTGANGDIIDLNGATVVTGVDSNGAATGIIFNATASNTVGDLVITGSNTSVWFATDGLALINGDNVKSQITGATAQNGEILIADGASGYLLHAASAGSSTFNVYRVFDNDGLVNGVVDARVELLGVVNMTNTFGDLTVDNVNQFFLP